MNKKEITVQLNLDTTEFNKQLEQIRKKIEVMILVNKMTDEELETLKEFMENKSEKNNE
ncbi:hypothetical protein [Clostridium senegalense]